MSVGVLGAWLISDDDASTTRSRYAATFSDYTFTAAWDATLWAGQPYADFRFDRPLPSDALETSSSDSPHCQPRTDGS